MSFCLNASTVTPGLLRADVLHVEAEDAGEFRQIVGVAAGLDHLQHVAAFHRRDLFFVQMIFRAIGVFVREECLAVGGVLNEKHILLSA